MDKELFVKLVSTPSYGENVTNREQVVIDLIRDYIKKYLPNMKFYDDANTTIPYIFASANKKPDIIFACHADTVPPSYENHLNPIYDGDRCIVLGGKDMKGGIASAIGALRSSLRNNAALLVYGDEEYNQLGILEMCKYIPRILLNPPRVIICPESRFNLVYNSRGFSVFDIEIKGKKAHSARPQSGIDAINNFYEAFQVLEKKYSKLTKLGLTTFAISSIRGGVLEGNEIKCQPNVCSDIVRATISIRISDYKMTGINYARLLCSLLERKGLIVKINIKADYPVRKTSNAIVKKMTNIALKQCKQKIEIGEPALSGYNDAVILGKAIKSPVINFGPYGEKNHTPNEWVSMKSIEMTENIFKAWIEYI